MGRDLMDYATMVEDALRDVVRKALIQVSENGLPGDHYFYITFRTDQPGVEMADYLRHRYPVEMTIVLQHQFWGLEVDDEGFSVLLSFNKVHERLRIPFRSLVGFSDPNAQFGLQFTVAEPEGASRRTSRLPAAAGERAPAGLPASAASGSGTGAERKAEGGEAPDGDRAGGAQAGTADAGPGGEGNVVTLDAFRKKQGQKD